MQEALQKGGEVLHSGAAKEQFLPLVIIVLLGLPTPRQSQNATISSAACQQTLQAHLLGIIDHGPAASTHMVANTCWACGAFPLPAKHLCELCFKEASQGQMVNEFLMYNLM